MGQPLFLVALAVVVTILLNPGLDGSVVLSSYADCGTMVAVGALGLFGVEMLARFADRDAGNIETLAWRFGFVGALLVNLKQANPVLLALVTAGLAIVALRDPMIAKPRALAQLPRMLGPAIIVFVVWRWYVMRNVPDGDQAFRPFDTWIFRALPSLFAAAWKQIVDAPLFHALMWMVTVVGFAAFFALPRRVSEAGQLAVVCATVWLGYNAFLLTVYLGVMTEREAATAGDYWRFTPHVALLALYVPVMGLATARWPAWISRGGAAPALAAALLALCTLPLRGDLNNPRAREWPHFIRDATTKMRDVMPPGSKAVIIQCWNESPFAVIVRYDLWQLGAPEREIRGILVADGTDPAVVTGLATRGEANYLIVQDAERVMDEVIDKLGLSQIDHELALFAWRNGAWDKVKSWPIPPALMDR
jgi:hypothetical protein